LKKLSYQERLWNPGSYHRRAEKVRQRDSRGRSLAPSPRANSKPSGPARARIAWRSTGRPLDGRASCERTSTTIEEPRALERLGDPRREHPIALRVRVNRIRAQRGVGHHVGESLLDQQHAFFLGELGIDRGVGQ